MRLTLYLFQPGIARFDQCIKPEDSKRQYLDVTNQENSKAAKDFQILLIKKEPKSPEWSRFFGSYIEPGRAEKLMSQQPAAVILFKIQTSDGVRFMAATNGSAYSVLERGLVEPDFGLKVTLASIVPSQLKNMQYSDLQLTETARNESVASPSSLAGFGYRFNSELVKSVSGRAVSPELGLTISGSDSLKLSIPELKIEQLQVVATEAFDRYTRQSYKENFGFIDDIRPVRALADVAYLDQQLVLALQDARLSRDVRLLLTQPKVFDDADHILLTVRGERERLDTLTVKQLLDQLGSYAPELSLETLQKEAHISGCDSQEDIITKRIALYKILALTVDDKQLGRCVLRGGRWFRVGKNVSSEASVRINDATVEVPLADWRWSKDGAEKHISTELPKDWEAVTGSFVTVSGYGRFAPADCIDRSNKTVGFVKKSSTMLPVSELLSRAQNLVELVRDGNSQIQNYLSGLGLDSKPTAYLRISFLIGVDGTLEQSLSEFDQLALARGIKELSRLGVQVSVLAIPIK